MLFHWRIIPLQGNGKITGEDENERENPENPKNPKNQENPRNQGKQENKRIFIYQITSK
jgi:hypothetical protein